jgi:hypothetical protein
MKTTPLAHGILALALLSSPIALAQEAKPAEASAAAPAPEGAPPPAPAPAPAPAPGEKAPAAESVDERIAALEAKLAKAEENTAALETSVSSLKKLKLSGYVQGRYEWHKDAVDGWENYKNENRFSVRHGYLGARYEGTYGEFFLQIDGNTSDGLVLKDAEATLVEPWTPFHIKLTIGQFKLPFGYEIGQSDADRELPERAAVITGVFPSDRDRGLRLQAKYEMFNLKVALVNGALVGIKDPTDKNYVTQNGYDPNGFKTVVGRLGADLGWLVGGLSGMWGRTLDTGKNPLESYDYTTYKKYEQTRLGADVQGYVDLPGVGGLALKGEVIWARKKSLDYNDLKANSCLDTRSFGWILTLVQNVGNYGGVAVRFDQYDPLLASTVDSTCHSAKETASRDKDKVYRLGVAGLLHASANTKFTLSYEHPWEQTGAKKSNDIVTAQIQARF